MATEPYTRRVAIVDSRFEKAVRDHDVIEAADLAVANLERAGYVIVRPHSLTGDCWCNPRVEVVAGDALVCGQDVDRSRISLLEAGFRLGLAAKQHGITPHSGAECPYDRSGECPFHRVAVYLADAVQS